MIQFSEDERCSFTAYFQSADVEDLGVVTGESAVKFLEKSGLPSTTLGKIWQIADTENQGFLTMQSFFVVMRLVGKAQFGLEISQDQVLTSGPMPIFKDENVEAVSQSLKGKQMAASNSEPVSVPSVPPLTPLACDQYKRMFINLVGNRARMSGEEARGIFMRTKLSSNILGQIWDVADRNKLGSLSMSEFIIAMHLISQKISGALKVVPEQIPSQLLATAAAANTVKSDDSALQASFHQSVTDIDNRVASDIKATDIKGQAIKLSAEDKAHFFAQFKSLDSLNKGFISGTEAVAFFIKSLLSEEELADIWDLADADKDGNLKADEFITAMALISRKCQEQNLNSKIFSFQTVIPYNRQVAARNESKFLQNDLLDLGSGLDSSYDAANKMAKPGNQVPRSISSPQAQRGFRPQSSFGQTLQHTGSSASISSPVKTDAANRADIYENGNSSVISPKKLNLTGQVSSSLPATPVSAEFSEVPSENPEWNAPHEQLSDSQRKLQQTNEMAASSKVKLDEVTNEKKSLTQMITQLREQYDTQVKAIQKMNFDTETITTDNSKLKKDYEILQASFEALNEQHESVKSRLQAAQDENDKMKSRIKQLNEDTVNTKKEIDKLIRTENEVKTSLNVTRIDHQNALEAYDRAQEELKSLSESIKSSKTEEELIQSVSDSTSKSTNPFMEASASASGSKIDGIQSVASPAEKRTTSFDRPVPNGSAGKPSASEFLEMFSDLKIKTPQSTMDEKKVNSDKISEIQILGEPAFAESTDEHLARKSVAPIAKTKPDSGQPSTFSQKIEPEAVDTAIDTNNQVEESVLHQTEREEQDFTPAQPKGSDVPVSEMRKNNQDSKEARNTAAHGEGEPTLNINRNEPIVGTDSKDHISSHSDDMSLNSAVSDLDKCMDTGNENKTCDQQNWPASQELKKVLKQEPLRQRPSPEALTEYNERRTSQTMPGSLPEEPSSSDEEGPSLSYHRKGPPQSGGSGDKLNVHSEPYLAGIHSASVVSNDISRTLSNIMSSHAISGDQVTLDQEAAADTGKQSLEDSSDEFSNLEEAHMVEGGDDNSYEVASEVEIDLDNLGYEEQANDCSRKDWLHYIEAFSSPSHDRDDKTSNLVKDVQTVEDKEQNASTQQMPGTGSEDTVTEHSQQSSTSTKPPAPAPPPPRKVLNDKSREPLIANLIDMGFSRQQSIEALESTKFDLELASNKLLDQTDS